MAKAFTGVKKSPRSHGEERKDANEDDDSIGITGLLLFSAQITFQRITVTLLACLRVVIASASL